MASTIDWRDFLDGYAEDTRAIEWLSASDSKTLHRCASDLNWDWGWSMQGWIVSQKHCFVSTAAMIFWMAQPQERIDPDLNEEEIKDRSSRYYLIKLILENFVANFFVPIQFPVFWNENYSERVLRFDEVLEQSPELKPLWSSACSLLPQIVTDDDTRLLSREGLSEGYPDWWSDDETD